MTSGEFDPVQWLATGHWLGAAVGLFFVLSADIRLLRLLLARPGATRRKPATRLHLGVIAALVLVLSSGVALAIIRSEAACALRDGRIAMVELGSICMPSAVVAKVMFFAFLLLISRLVDTRLRPLLRRIRKGPAQGLTAGDITRAATLIGASLACSGALALLAFVQAIHALPLLAMMVLAAILWAIIAGTLAFVLSLRRPALAPVIDETSVAVPHDASARGTQRLFAIAGGRSGPQSESGFAGPPDNDVVTSPLPPGNGGGHWNRILQNLTPVQDNQRSRNAPSSGVAGYADQDTGRADESDTRQVRRETGEPGDATVEGLVRSSRRTLWGLGGISFAINLLMLTGPLFMLQVYDRVLTSRSVATLGALTILLVSLYAFMGVLDVIRARVLSRLAVRVDSRLAGELLDSTVVPPPSAREVSAQPLRDLEQIRNFISGPGPAAFLDLPWVPLYCGMVFLLHPLLGWLTVAGALLLVGLSLAGQVSTRQRLARSAEQVARSHAIVEMGRANAETLRAMGMIGAHRERWQADHREAMARQLEAGDMAAGFAGAIRIGRLLLQSLLLATGAWLALNEAVSGGVMIAASIIATRALAPVEQIVAQWRALIATLGAVSRCRKLLSEIPPARHRLTLPPPQGRLTVSKLYVAAPGQQEPMLKGITFAVEPGDALAVIGPSASGKSTLARALIGIWPVRHGEIRLDGASLSQWHHEALGRHLGYLPQDVSLFAGTVAENIARLESAPDAQNVIAAARLAGVHELILRLPQGYETRVGENGVALSGGQRQRIALARAVYGQPSLIVMDEPNASLDAEGEQALVEAIMRLRKAGSTVVVMAHRRSVIAACNRLLVLKQGRQVAFGKPEGKAPPGQEEQTQHSTREKQDGRTAKLRVAVAGT